MISAVFQVVQRDRALRAFLELDREAAMRILTCTRSALQRGVAEVPSVLIDLEAERGTFVPELDTPMLVYAMIRISESFLYADFLADREPDIERGRTVVEALLRALDSSRH